MKRMRTKMLGALALSLALSMVCSPLSVSAQEYQDRSAVLDTGFTLDTDYTLQLANPTEDISTTSEYYYITGSSDPDYALTCNGEEVEDRGIYGSFGIYAELEMGANTSIFKMELTQQASPSPARNPLIQAMVWRRSPIFAA